uniref:Putative secreted protein n=1 Tax=Anopheles darlingi TaxID=43151 RepID=A0A2M4DQA8_ANODA
MFVLFSRVQLAHCFRQLVNILRIASTLASCPQRLLGDLFERIVETGKRRIIVRCHVQQNRLRIIQLLRTPRIRVKLDPMPLVPILFPVIKMLQYFCLFIGRDPIAHAPHTRFGIFRVNQCDHPARSFKCATVINAVLIEPTQETLYVTRPLFLERKVRLPHQRSIPKNPNILLVHLFLRLVLHQSYVFLQCSFAHHFNCSNHIGYVQIISKQ